MRVLLPFVGLGVCMHAVRACGPSDDTSWMRSTDTTSQICRQDFLFTPPLSLPLDSAFSPSPLCLWRVCWGAPLQPPFSDPRSPLGPFSPFGLRPHSLPSPFCDLHTRSLALFRPWGAPFQPQFSDPRSALAPVAAWATPLQPPFSDLRSALAADASWPVTPSSLHFPFCDRHSSQNPLGRALPASILRSPICTRSHRLPLAPFGPHSCSFHSPISDLHSQANVRTSCRDGGLMTRA